MKETIALLRGELPRDGAPRALVIGGQVDKTVCKEVGADDWTNDAMKGVRLCQKIMG
jgi:methanogenic corrinoid protein MtbC1